MENEFEITKRDCGSILVFAVYEKHHHSLFTYYLDLDKYRLIVTGEVSSSYKWVETKKTESFLKLMCRCDKYYLLNKLFDESFKCYKAIECVKKIVENDWDDDMKKYEMDEDDISSFLDDVDNIDVESYEGFVKELEKLCGTYFYTYEFEDLFPDFYGNDLKDYDHWQYKSIEHFQQAIVPLLNEIVKEEQ